MKRIFTIIALVVAGTSANAQFYYQDSKNSEMLRHAEVHEACRKEVILPAGITSIDQFAFVSCSSLEKVYFTDTDVSAIEIAENNDDLTVDKIYAYSAEMPTESGRFWHYDDNGEPTAW